MKNKLTFKKEKRETGLAGMGRGDSTLIKIDGQVVGSLTEASWNSSYSGWRIGLRVKKTEEPVGNGDWKWIFFKKTHETEKAARTWLKAQWSYILLTYLLSPETD